MKALRDLPDNDIAPSDIWGCPQRATEIFQPLPASTIKYLVMASDMEIAGMQEYRAVQLKGVHFAVINYLCDDVNECADKTNYWTSHMQAAGVADLQFLHADQTDAVSQLFA